MKTEAAEQQMQTPQAVQGWAAPPPQMRVAAAIQAVMNAVGYVHKAGTNEFHKYSYATEADTIRALRGEMLKQNLIMVPSLMKGPNNDEHGNTHIVMGYTFHHTPSGERITVTIPGSGNDRNSKGGVGDKGIYKAMTGALKYALRQTFMIETGDDPEQVNEVDRGATTPPPPVQEVNHLLSVANTLVALSHNCDSQGELEGVWKANLGNIELLKREHAELFDRVRDAFSMRRKFLSSTQPKDI